jgi:hypothetical protein
VKTQRTNPRSGRPDRIRPEVWAIAAILFGAATFVLWIGTRSSHESPATSSTRSEPADSARSPAADAPSHASPERRPVRPDAEPGEPGFRIVGGAAPELQRRPPAVPRFRSFAGFAPELRKSPPAVAVQQREASPLDPSAAQDLRLAEIAAERAAEHLGLAGRVEDGPRESANDADGRRSSMSDALIVELMTRQQQLRESYADGTPAADGNALVVADLARWVAGLAPRDRQAVLNQALAELD